MGKLLEIIGLSIGFTADGYELTNIWGVSVPARQVWYETRWLAYSSVLSFAGCSKFPLLHKNGELH